MLYISVYIFGHEASAGTLNLNVNEIDDTISTRSLIHRVRRDGGVIIDGTSACVIFVNPVICDVTGWVRDKQYHIWLANECVKHIRGDASIIQTWRDDGIN